MDPARYVVFGVVGLGGAVAVWCVFVALTRHGVNVEVLGEQLVKLISANNLDRAVKLCAAMPKPYAVQVLRPMIEAARDGAGETELRQVLINETERQSGRERIDTIGAIIALAGLASGVAFDWTFPGTPRGTASAAAGIGVLVVLFALGKASKQRAQTLRAAETVIAALNKLRARS